MRKKTSNFILIILLAAFPPLSTDMYLPAIPTLCTIWGITLVQANLSLVAFFIMGFSFFGSLGGSSDIYIRSFGMTEQVYSLYFAFNALALTLGSLLCARMLVNVESNRILFITLVGMFFATGTLLILGKATPTNFALAMEHGK